MIKLERSCEDYTHRMIQRLASCTRCIIRRSRRYTHQNLQRKNWKEAIKITLTGRSDDHTRSFTRAFF
uniref:Uncharacterized protein n=1 Tax=Arundo donax TaxID=35708 RepID=A0A0A9E2S1_ARUDO